MRGMELVDIFLFVISLNGILLSPKSMFSLHFQEEFSIQDIIRFVQSDQSCEFFLQEIPSLIRQDNLTSHQNGETCTLLTSFDNSSSNETIRLSGIVVRLYANVKKYEFSMMPNQCKGNSSFNEIQIHVSCQPTKAHNVNICDDGRGCNTEREFCRKLFEDENEKELCIARRNLFESCDKDVQCTQTTKCKNMFSYCKKVFEVMGGKCLPVGMSLNESCSHDRQCTGTANAGRCLQNNQSPGGGVCSCDSGFFQEGSNCLQGSRRLFQSCESHRQCTGTYGARECKVIAGIQMCHCPDNYTVLRNFCLKVGSVIGETCISNAECTGTQNGGRCVYNEVTRTQTCACDEDFLTNGSYCLPVNKTLFETCEVDDQCNGTLGLEICRTVGDRKMCVCGSQYIEDMTSLTCHKGSRRLFQSCEFHRQCTGTYGARECKVIAGIQMCHCPDNHTIVKDVCIKVIGETCTINEECTGTQNGGRCVYSEATRTQTCACDEDFLTNGSHCLPVNKKLFETCEVNDQCNGTLGLEICRPVGDRKVCVCGSQYIADMASLTCQKVGKGIFDACTMDAKCTRTKNADVCQYNTVSQGNSCACKNGFEWVNVSCVPIGRQLLESCQYCVQCNGTTHATVCGLFGNRSLCFCNKGIVEFNGKCTEGGWNEEIMYRFIFVGAGGLLFGIFYSIVILVRKCRRNILSRSGRFVVQSDQENMNLQSTLYAVPSDIRNYVEPSTFVHQDTQRLANYTYNHLNEPVEKEDNAFSQQMFVEQDTCDDVYNHLHEKEAPLCQGMYDVAENVSKGMFQSSDDDPKSTDFYDFAEPIDVNTF